MWKKDENGNLVADDKGNPILITADGKEEGFSLEANKQHISSINAESASRRKEIDSLKDQLKPFEGLDPTKAREAIEKVKSFSEKDLVDIAEVEKNRAEMRDGYEKQLEEERSRSTQFENQLKNYIVGGEFVKSQFIADKLNIPVDMVQNTFGKHFMVNDRNQVVALRDPNDKGSVIPSQARPGEPASFDEALAKFVNAYPNKDQILKSSGNQGGGTGNSGGAPTGLKRSEMSAADRATYIQKHGQDAYLKLQK